LFAAHRQDKGYRGESLPIFGQWRLRLGEWRVGGLGVGGWVVRTCAQTQQAIMAKTHAAVEDERILYDNFDCQID
jgi:hypothetical protein